MNPSLIPTVSVAVKLASIAVHADELLSEGGSVEFDGVEFDGGAIRALLVDREVVDYLADLESLALLPVKRGAS